MTFEVKEKNGILIVVPNGRLVASCSKALKTIVTEHFGTTNRVLFDLSKMAHIDSSGLGMLVHLLQKANAGGGSVKLACLQAHPRIVFDITKVYRVFEMFDTVEAALASFK